MTRKKSVLYAVIAVPLVLALLEGLCSFGWLAADAAAYRKDVQRVMRFREEFHCKHDPEIGWTHIPGKHIEDFYGPGRHITIDPLGFRGTERDIDKARKGRKRVVCLGDSFTLGYGVDDDETFPARLAALNPAVQTVNMGQGGYSVGQCYLWYRRDGAPLKPDVVVFAYITGDMFRMANIRTVNGYAMPKFQLKDGRIDVGGQPLPDKLEPGAPLAAAGRLADFLAEKSALVRTMAAAVGRRRRAIKLPADPRPHLLKLSFALFAQLRMEASRQGTAVALVQLPTLRELEDPVSAKDYRTVSETARKFASSQGIPFLDLFDAFLKDGRADESLFLDERWRHYSEKGNALAARRIDVFLSKSVPGYPTAGKRAASP